MHFSFRKKATSLPLLTHTDYYHDLFSVCILYPDVAHYTKAVRMVLECYTKYFWTLIMNQIFALNFGAEITQNYIWIFSTKNQIIDFFYLLQNEIWVIFLALDFDLNWQKKLDFWGPKIQCALHFIMVPSKKAHTASNGHLKMTNRMARFFSPCLTLYKNKIFLCLQSPQLYLSENWMELFIM